MDQVEIKNEEANEELTRFIEAGIHVGHPKRKRHPQMRQFIYGTRNNIEIIDVVKTKEQLEVASEFLRKIAQAKGTVLFVGTRPGIRERVQKAAEELGMPFITTRWVGGMLTNLSVISKRIKDMEELRRIMSTGEIDKFPKKERLRKERELRKFQKLYGWVRTISQLPQALVIFDVAHEDVATEESNKVGIPTIGIVDTDANPTKVTYAIPANDDALSSVDFILERLKEAFKQGREEVQTEENVDIK